jgi:hypothetical protein
VQEAGIIPGERLFDHLAMDGFWRVFVVASLDSQDATARVDDRPSDAARFLL